MNRKRLLSVGGLTLLLGLSACDNDKQAEPAPEPTLAETLSTLYSGEIYPKNILELEYLPADPLPGKEAEFSTADLRSGTLTLRNVIPGESATTIPVTMSAVNGNAEQFSLTTARSPFTTSGGVTLQLAPSTVEAGRLNLNFASVSFPDNPLNRNSLGGEWWGPKPSGGLLGAGCVYFKWRVTPGSYAFTDPDTGQTETVVITEANAENPGGLVSLLPLALNQILPKALSHIRFQHSGVIRARYATDPLGDAPLWHLSPEISLCQFYVKEGTAYAIPSIPLIYEQVTAGGTKADAGLDIDFDQLQELYALLSGWNNNGIPLVMQQNQDAEGSVTLYLETSQLKPLLGLLPPLLPQIKALIPESMQSMLGPVIDKLPLYIPITEKIELGLTLVPVAEPAR